MTCAKHPGVTRLGRAGAVGAGMVLLGSYSELVAALLTMGVILVLVVMMVLALAGAFARRKVRRDAASQVLKQLLEFLRPG